MKALKGIKLILLIALFFSCGSKQELKEETKQVKLVSNIIEVDTKFFIEKILCQRRGKWVGSNS